MEIDAKDKYILCVGVCVLDVIHVLNSYPEEDSDRRYVPTTSRLSHRNRPIVDSQFKFQIGHNMDVGNVAATRQTCALYFGNWA